MLDIVGMMWTREAVLMLGVRGGEGVLRTDHMVLRWIFTE